MVGVVGLAGRVGWVKLKGRVGRVRMLGSRREVVGFEIFEVGLPGIS